MTRSRIGMTAPARRKKTAVPLVRKATALVALRSPTDPEKLGARLRHERERQGLALRELARRIGVSPSLVSQIERGLVTPSVGTLWSMTAALGLIMDELFRNPEQDRPAGGRGNGGPPPRYVQRAKDRARIRLAGGVEWERLTPQADDDVEFLYVKYAPGAESCPEEALIRHGGMEYAYVLSGRLGVQIGFDKYELGPGDSLSFGSQIPHRLWTIGSEPAIAVWAIVNRTNDERAGS